MPPGRSALPVLIVGAGPTGLVLAIELARRGVSFHLIERRPEPVHWSQAIFVKSRTLEILAALGLHQRLYAHGQIVNGVDLYRNDLRVSGYRFDHLDTPFRHILSIPESEVIAILTDKLEQLGGRVERGVEFVGLEDHGDGVRARIRSDAGGERDIEAGWVVGTDGYHSAVREAVGDAFDGRDYPELWGVFDTDIAGWDRPRDIVCAQLEVPIAIPFPLGERRWRVYFRTTDDKPGSLAAVAARLAVVCPDVRLDHPEEPQYFRCHSKLARNFRVGRVFLAGDAAHASNPVEGHGMNAGIQDAWNLGWKLAAIVAGNATEALIESYEAERRSADRDIVRSGEEAYARMMPEGRKALDEAYAFLSTPEGRDFAALAESEIAFSYAASPIVEEIGTAPEAGGQATPIGCRVGDVDRLVLDGAPLRLHELLADPDTVAIVLLGASDRAAIAAATSELETVTRGQIGALSRYVAVRGNPPPGLLPAGVLLDPDGHLHDRLGADEPTLCVIRPDGHLGLRCRAPFGATLKAHLARQFATL